MKNRSKQKSIEPSGIGAGNEARALKEVGGEDRKPQRVMMSLINASLPRSNLFDPHVCIAGRNREKRLGRPFALVVEGGGSRNYCLAAVVCVKTFTQ